jgi:hypothetical protein
MLAYLLWHRPAEGVQREAYERVAEGFHRSLAHRPPAGFRGSALFRVLEPSWLGARGGGEPVGSGDVGRAGGDAQTGAGAAQADSVYEDWYLVDDFTALGILNEAAVAHGHRSAHDEIAHRFGSGAGGLYGLLEGHASLREESQLAIWIARPVGAARAGLGELLGDGMEPQRSSLWRRALVLGPAPEYCLLAPEPPAGVATTRLPGGWRASVSPRETLWRG